MAKFNKDVAWLESFYETAKDLLPKGKLTKVRGFSVPLDKIEQTDGQCASYDNKIIITLRTMRQLRRANQNGTQTAYRHQRIPVYDTLIFFAHELAHLRHWTHTPKHWELECRILRRFISELKRRGVKDVTVGRLREYSKED